ncbi:MAG: CotH kinase family protein [Verrucomicrobiota bacterium]
MASSFPFRTSSFLFTAVLFLSVLIHPAGAAPSRFEIAVTHSPRQPKSGESVTVSIDAPTALLKGDAILQYQIVEPGAYIALDDPAYAQNWTKIALSKPAAHATDPARVLLKAELPAELQKHRRLIRYRLFSVENQALVAPQAEDSEPNFAYFVYDGIPGWRAAINPKGSKKERESVTFSPEVMRSVQAYHLISRQASVENVTWNERFGYMQPAASEYKYRGTFVADGQVYDHIRFRARGGAWRHAMGKNMWKINFNKGHHFQAHDNRGQKYKAKWGKLNLGACIQQGDYGMRGEHGMLEAVTFRLFNMAGVDAPHTHWVQLRIIDEAKENPASQYEGDFWGLYLVVENLDEDFLKEHALPDGNLYKMDVMGPEPENLGKGAPTDRSDVLQFMRDLRSKPDEKWWRSNVHLPRYYSYRSIVECVHHYDIGAGKNYFYFHHPEEKRWQVVPWDVDLTWNDEMFGNGAEPFFRTGFLRQPPFQHEYATRLAELRDLLFNPEQTGALIDEYAAVIWNPKGAPSMVDADRAKWDYHPIMSSPLTVRGKSDPGLFYQGAPTHNFPGMLQVMKNYIEERGRWIDQTLLADAGFPPTPVIAPPGKPDPSTRAMTMRLQKPDSAQKIQWRLAEITNPAASTLPRKYEIDPLWVAEEGAVATVPARELKGGHLYRVRARIQNSEGRWSRWSAPAQFTMPE